MKRALIACGLAVAMISLIGCKKKETTPEATTAAVTTVNMTCPVMSDHEVDPHGATADFAGVKVGFCCDKCVDKWNEMTDDAKTKFVEAAKAANPIPEG